MCKNAEPLLEADTIFNESIAPVNKDHIYDELFKVPDDQEFQIMTQQMLTLLCSAILLVLESQCEDQLPGGKYFDPSEKLKIQVSNVVTSNIISERDFARFDNILKTKPRSTVTSLEATIMWSSNKPAKWLDTLNDEEREKNLKRPETLQKVLKKTWKNEGNKF